MSSRTEDEEKERRRGLVREDKLPDFEEELKDLAAQNKIAGPGLRSVMNSSVWRSPLLMFPT
ncbi:hypothetical protein F7725_016671 [Dissostichus mawsoni]|uniref:Uncharacterized protein n=1 Tax=Dissostichus mawsoni TaxID=36200 RepID=A0A7J5Z6H4_DISMA|nr:hypothetical protein F7725_016671 [Dissostichus mawsoni]